MFPYNTKFEKKHKESINNFQSVVGGFSRNLNNLKLKDLSINEQWIDDIISHVTLEHRHKTILKSIIKNLFFDNNEVNLFHPEIFNYIKCDSTTNTIDQSLAKFLFDVLLENCDDALHKLIFENYQCNPQNVLANLILESLPPLPEVQKQTTKYKGCIPLISNLFREDFNFMLNDSHFFLSSFDKLLKFYYFIYVSQLIMKLNQFLAMDSTHPEPIYFNLDWESVSKSRTSYNRGWKLLEPKVHNIFSHVHCLELLNHNYLNQTFSYEELTTIIRAMDDDEQFAFLNDIKQLKNTYIEHISDVNFESLNVTRNSEDKIEIQIQNEIIELFNAIDYQFNIARKSPYKRYAQWFEEFCKTYFLKPRGNLGNTLNLSEEYLIFITKLCIKNKDRLRLKLLFKEYEKRGLYFDRDSQNKIVQLFEKLNLIDKKSDSGDAQYVKAIL